MTTRVQADILPTLIDWLGPQLDDVVVRLGVPDVWTPADGAVLILADDGGPFLWPVKSRHTVRLTAYAAGRSAAGNVVRRAAGLLGAHRPPGVVSVDRDMGVVLETRDRDTGAFLASILVTMHARSVVL